MSSNSHIRVPGARVAAIEDHDKPVGVRGGCGARCAPRRGDAGYIKGKKVSSPDGPTM